MKDDLKFIWGIVTFCCWGSFLICAPLVAFTGGIDGPWWTGAVITGYFWAGFGTLGSVVVGMQHWLERRR